MNAVLHQLGAPEQLDACLARCAAGDAIVLLADAARLADQAKAWPVTAVLILSQDEDQSEVTGPPSPCRLINDQQWVTLVAEYPLTMGWF